MKQDTVWSDISPISLDTHSIYEAEGHYDIAIVGCGYTALNAAITLAKAGKKVIIFEENKATSLRGCPVVCMSEVCTRALWK